ncbi:MAG: acetyl-CoA carboxylase, biotin carboxyl carrier protein [Omnitrophica bacterium RIFCSPLOWO2_01_FULL_45_10]|nr:MAG: acetyl-CoA carboxylase, biotin carboxyl carrier protein [Omnitrophica bacterium RIFCSPLOWO2_01_FULL_45_10]
MYIKEIKDLINLMNENNLTEVEVEKDGLKIRLRKGAGAEIEKTVEIIPQKITPQLEKTGKAQATAEKKNVVEIKAPMVGTFYRTPSPEAPPYINIGSEIEPGQVVCIIEAMKLMNEIKSEVKGRIVDILVENSEPVEYGQALFVVESI